MYSTLELLSTQLRPAGCVSFVQFHFWLHRAAFDVVLGLN
jgi:hypothetical protein